ncbi:hypothetical protein GGI64_002963 [Rhizobium leguminosarum]|uniref:Uncharacterized protein n=1 Tax=Rhizobium leguminosarum TaxID=384 RepID=A0A7Z0DZN4_RHILE|nr:hypothetical protein [Rhizobium leguminosarum]
MRSFGKEGDSGLESIGEHYNRLARGAPTFVEGASGIVLDVCNDPRLITFERFPPRQDLVDEASRNTAPLERRRNPQIVDVDIRGSIGVVVNVGRNLADNLLSANRDDHQVPRRPQIGCKPLGTNLLVENLIRDIFKQNSSISREATRCDHVRHRSLNPDTEGSNRETISPDRVSWQRTYQRLIWWKIRGQLKERPSFFQKLHGFVQPAVSMLVLQRIR